MRKNKWAFILLVMLLCLTIQATGEEIRFDSIEWLEDESTVINKLLEDGLVAQSSISSLSRENNSYLVPDDVLIFQPPVTTASESFCYSLKAKGKGKIAGSPVDYIVLTYAYDGNYKLIAVKVELLGMKYEDLKAKLRKIYGDSVAYNDDDLGIYSDVWYGDNNSGILLYTESGGLDYSLIYGRTDAEDILANCLLSDPDDVSGL